MINNRHHETASKDRIPVNQKLAFGLGMAVPIAFVNSVAQLTNLFFNLELKISVVWIGVALMLPRLWDAVTDPVAGIISDNFRSRWGRRRPFIVGGGVLVAVTYVLIWWVPTDWDKTWLISYYLVVSLLFYTAVTIYSVPLVALGYEMTDDYHEKTRLFAYGSFFGNVFAIATPWMYAVANWDMFEDRMQGMKLVALLVGGIILVTTLWPGFACKEKNQELIVSQKPVKFWTGMRATVGNKAFLKIVVVVFLVTAGFNFVNNFANYITIFYVYGGDKDAAAGMLGINGTVWAITALLAVFPMTWCSGRLGKAKTVQVFVVLMLVGCVAKIVCYNPAHPWLMVIPTVLIASGMLVLFTMAGAMISDVCNEDELKTGVKREGSYSAVYSWWIKVAVSIGYLVSGFLMDSTGFDVEVLEQSADTLLWMRIWEIGVPAVMSGIGIWMLSNYSLTEDRAYEIKELLEEQRKTGRINQNI